MFGDVKELYLKNTYSGGEISAAGGLDRSAHPINSYSESYSHKQDYKTS